MTHRPSLASGLLAAGIAFTALAACAPLYLPPQPTDVLVAESRLRLLGTSALVAAPDDPAAAPDGPAAAPDGRQDTRLVLMLGVAEVPRPGWLAVQWFGPSGAVVASESIWLEPRDAGGARRLEPPRDLEIRPGEWRAIVSWYGGVVRQFRVDAP